MRHGRRHPFQAVKKRDAASLSLLVTGCGLSSLVAAPAPFAELPENVGAPINSAAFRADGGTFAIPVDSRGTVGVFRIKPERTVRALTARENRAVNTLIRDLDADQFARRIL